MDEPGCAVLVMSCGAYRDLWTPFFTLFWRYWPDCPFEVYLGTDCETFDDRQVTMLAVGNHEWSDKTACVPGAHRSAVCRAIAGRLFLHAAD